MKRLSALLFIFSCNALFGHAVTVVNLVTGDNGQGKTVYFQPIAVWGRGTNMFGQTHQQCDVKKETMPDGSTITTVKHAGCIGNDETGDKYLDLKKITYGDTVTYSFDEMNLARSGYLDAGLCFARFEVGVQGRVKMGALVTLPIVFVPNNQLASTIQAAQEFGNAVQQAAEVAAQVAAAAYTGGASEGAMAAGGALKTAAAGAKELSAASETVSTVKEAVTAAKEAETARKTYSSKLSSVATGFVSASKDQPGFLGSMISGISNLIKTSFCHDLKIHLVSDPNTGEVIGLVPESAS